MPRKELTPELAQRLEGQKVRVHRNLNNGAWSITHHGKVVAHAEALRLHGVEFVVQGKARDRAKLERVRNVHAWAEGTFTSRLTDYTSTIVTYHPFLDKGFRTLTHEPVYQATAVKFTPQGVCMAGNINQLLL